MLKVQSRARLLRESVYNDLMLDQDEQELLGRFHDMLRERYGPCELLIFGSRARRTHQKDSDMDVLVLLERPLEPGIESALSELAWEASFGSGIILSPLVENADNWRHGPASSSLLALAIQREGVVA